MISSNTSFGLFSLLEQLKKEGAGKELTPETIWQKMVSLFLDDSPLPFSTFPFSVQHLLYKTIYACYGNQPAPAWFPGNREIQESNLAQIMQQKDYTDYSSLHQWSCQHYTDFWQTMLDRLNIRFDKPFNQIFHENTWFPEARLNIVNSCFHANPLATAVISQDEKGNLRTFTYQELDLFSNQIANGILQHFQPGDAIAVIMPMTVEAVAIYLGIIKAGCVVISIADSFSAEEIGLRLTIAKAKGIFTQESFQREGKRIKLYDRIQQAAAVKIIVIPEDALPDTLPENAYTQDKTQVSPLRPSDMLWQDFLSKNTEFKPIACVPSAHINILFSSGTTADPKAIPWNHTTPIKCASDAFLHHNVKSEDRFCWPTNLGWMMGPWLIFATLINKATIMLYQGISNGSGFGKFVQDHKITHLGVVPTLVKSWRSSGCMENLDWSNIKIFTSTGECSNEEDMLYLMALGRYRPLIEYCGGTEIGGGYISGTVLQPSAPAAFSTAAMGLDFVILDEQGNISDKGEVAIIPPSLGLSTELLNKDHNEVYYQDMPIVDGIQLRRHGDELERYPNGYYRIHGRTDDTMNLSGIKISSAEIERVLNTHSKVLETAAIAIEPTGGGPSQLIIYVVLKKENVEAIMPEVQTFKNELQNILKQHLNPLFKIHNIAFVSGLPRTASNKVMRRSLRKEYQARDTARDDVRGNAKNNELNS